MPTIQRIDSYDDRRFSQAALWQHGAFVVGGESLYEVEIIARDAAVIRGDPVHYGAVMAEFRFYAEHISTFYDVDGHIVAQFAPVACFPVALADIQPSQFVVSAAKMDAIGRFIHAPEDVAIPLLARGGRYISLDGHTRLAVAVDRGYARVQGFLAHSDKHICHFADEAARRGVLSPYELTRVGHAEYIRIWYGYCDEYFAKAEAQGDL